MELPKQVKDLTGERWGYLTAKRYSHSKRAAFWVFLCDCGTEKVFAASLVRVGKRTSCGCKNRSAFQPGMIFKGCTLLKKIHSEGHGSKSAFLCHCGNFFSALTDNVARGSTTSCGCRHYTMKGKSRQKSYQVWRGMVSRCTNKDDKRYQDYGGRGVTICERWMDYFLFLEDMGDPPEGLTMDRIDNTKGYSPENCKWSTSIEQANNKRNNRFIEYKGRRQTMAMWAREKGINVGTLKSRLDKGWDVERALEE